MDLKLTFEQFCIIAEIKEPIVLDISSHHDKKISFYYQANENNTDNFTKQVNNLYVNFKKKSSKYFINPHENDF
jgi:hypothetical protein